jgi:SpoVK/Ycf46/Vps4 family AAA+-type ATPase
MNAPHSSHPTNEQRPLSFSEAQFDFNAWEQANNRFLEAALAWLRLNLRHYVQNQAPARPKKSGLFGWQPPEESRVSEHNLNAARKHMDKAAGEVWPLPALYLLGERFGLSEFERDVILLCAGLELDPGLGELCAAAQAGAPNPTFALARSLFNNPSWEAFSPERPLRHWHLIEISQPGAQFLTTSPLRADERIVSFIKGLNYIDDRLAPLLIPFDAALPGSPACLPLPPSQQAVADAVLHSLVRAVQSGEGLLVQLSGPDGLSKQLIALEATHRAQLNLFRLPAEWLPNNAAELESLARLWERENILQPVTLYLDARETGDEISPEGQSGALARFLSRSRGIVLLDTREARPELGRSGLSLDIEKPQIHEQAAAWVDFLGGPSGNWPARLAGQFNLNLPTIRQVAATALADESRLVDRIHPDAEPPLCDQASVGALAWQICLSRTRPRLDRLAQRIDPKARWEDIVLPEEPLGLLREICGQVEQRLRVYETWGLREDMNRGLGISALFFGESGAGKTMAAEVIANALCLNLYRIDLSAVVSKYIGETEKNLRRLFDAAEDGGVILFFDEADALFGKRSEVKDSHDRYANIEVNYLLQRMEAFHGLAILATNMKSALDQAFLRRLRFIVNLPFPGSVERQRIWARSFAPGLPLDELDEERLARFNLTGGSIHNIAINAAFLAANQPAPVVTMERVLQALRTELRKLEKPINEKDLEWKLDSPARQRIWQRAFQPDAPWIKGRDYPPPDFLTVDLDYPRLASFDLPAGSIYNIAARAILQNATGDEMVEVHTVTLLALIKAELRTQGKPVREQDFAVQFAGPVDGRLG